MAALDEINYLLRPNKNIERKLIVSALAAISDDFNLPTYRYIGLASLWFVDFLLAYRVLGIQKLIAIERPANASRVAFNRPLRTVQVVEGDSTQVLPSLALSKHRSIVWMDYEGGLHTCEALADIQILCEELPSGSIVLITLNAHERINKNKFIEALGDYAPSDPPQTFFDKSNFPKNLANLLRVVLERLTRKSGRPERFQTMFNFYYKDGTPMVTVGGMIAGDKERAALGASVKLSKLSYVMAKEQVRVVAPPLTTREKLALDQLLPSPAALSESDVARLGFKLKREQIDAYRAFFDHYPLFGELQH